MRLRNALAVGVTAATIAPAVLTGSVATAAALTSRATADTIAKLAEAARAGPPPLPGPPEAQQPTCGKATDRDFPIDTRIHGGPAVQRPGGGFELWSVDLTNTTAMACRSIHPVIVFTGRDSGLVPDRMALEFYDEQAARWRPVALETTTEEEIVGVLGDGFPGFVVPAKKSVTVKVRVAIGADVPSTEVTVNAAIVQRKGDDGDWVGESGDYRFAVIEENGAGSATTVDELATTGTGSLLRLGIVIGTVLPCSGVLVLASRRLRARRR
jgi:hypothetical protein